MSIVISYRKKSKRKKRIWKEEYYVKAYILAKAGCTDKAIARGLGVPVETLSFWKKKFPALARAIKDGKNYGMEHMTKGTGTETFQEYVYKRLSPELKELWDKIHKCEKEQNGIMRIEALLAEKGKRIRQQLFIYALVNSNFNYSEACRRINIPKHEFDRWCMYDPGFGELVDEMHWHKGNLFESALIKLVKQGEPSIVKFVNQTYNKDRGYTEKINVEVNGKVDVGISLEDLDLPLETRKQLLTAIRLKKEPKLVEQVEETSEKEIERETDV